MTDLEVMSLLLAALIHDVDHPGTSNSFQINQQSVSFFTVYPTHTMLCLLKVRICSAVQ